MDSNSSCLAFFSHRFPLADFFFFSFSSPGENDQNGNKLSETHIKKIDFWGKNGELSVLKTSKSEAKHA